MSDLLTALTAICACGVLAFGAATTIIDLEDQAARQAEQIADLHAERDEMERMYGSCEKRFDALLHERGEQDKYWANN